MSTSSRNLPERRHYFRIDDEIHLQLRIIDEEEYLQRLSQTGQTTQRASDPALQLHELNSQGSGLLAQIRKRDPGVAQYLTLLDRKLELLSQALLGNRFAHITGPSHKVEISGGGVSFCHHEALPVDTRLNLNILLFPTRLSVECVGSITHCNPPRPPRQNCSYVVGVEFTGIEENTREALIRHTLELQSTRLRRSRD